MAIKLSEIATRIPVLVMTVAAIVATTVGGYSYFESSSGLHQQASQRLIALNESRAASISSYLSSIEEDISILSSSAEVASALTSFEGVFHELGAQVGAEERQLLQALYSSDEPVADHATTDPRGSQVAIAYSERHDQHHPWLKSIVDLKGYYDLFLISEDGDVVYTAIKEPDFATNLITEQWTDTGLAEVFREAVTASADDPIAFVDFAPYAPSNGAPASFIAQKIVVDGRLLGVLALQMPIDRINSVMQVTAGMGESGETYIVGRDYLMRTDSRFSDRSTILSTRVETLSVQQALNGDSGVHVIEDYRGTPVLSAFRPLAFQDTNWALLAEIDVTEVEVPINAMLSSIVWIGIGLTSLVTALGVIWARSMMRPLGEITDAIEAFKNTRSVSDIPHTERKDEIGVIATGFHNMAHQVAGYIRMIDHAHEELSTNEREIRIQQARIDTIMQNVPDAIISIDSNGMIESVNRATSELFGYSFEELIGQNVRILTQEDVAEKHDLHIANYLESGEGNIIGNGPRELKACSKSGAILDIDLAVGEIRNENLHVFVGVIRDISKRKEDERQLFRMQETFTAVINQLPTSIAIKDVDGKIVLLNDTYREWFQPPEDAVGKGIEGLYEPDVVAEIEAIDRKVIETGAPITRELNQTFPDGTEHILQMTKFPLVDIDGAVFAVGAIDLDITKIRTAQNEIAAKEALLRTALESMPGAMVVVDQDLRIAAVNDTYKDYYGDPDGLIGVGRSMVDVLKSEIDRGILGSNGTDRETLEDRLNSLTSSEATTYEDRSPDGRYIHLSRNRAPGGYNVTVSIDVTERKNAEIALANAHDQITASIEYASRIQRAALPTAESLAAALDDHFVIWQPRDVVSGDIFWLREIEDGFVIAVADCTGHGVPGGFLTMIATGALRQSLIENRDGDPANVISRMNRFVQNSLNLHGSRDDADDGLELGICRYRRSDSSLTFSGARFSLWKSDEDGIKEIKGDKMAVGYHYIPRHQAYSNHVVEVTDSATFYMFSDGMIDQIGGERRRAFGKKRIVSLLHDHRESSLTAQADAILTAFSTYQGEEHRRDDVTMLGFRLPIGTGKNR